MKMLENLRGQFATVLTRDEMKNVVGGLLDLEDDEKNPHPCKGVGTRDLYCCNEKKTYENIDCYELYNNHSCGMITLPSSTERCPSSEV